jgi:hypothetical protein
MSGVRVDVTGGDLHHEEDVDLFEGDGAVDVEEVAGQLSCDLGV